LNTAWDKPVEGVRRRVVTSTLLRKTYRSVAKREEGLSKAALIAIRAVLALVSKTSSAPDSTREANAKARSRTLPFL
jgi:hypothetical protein